MKIKNSKQPHDQRLGVLKNGNPPCDLTKLPRCSAKAKHSGQRCRQPAMKNGKCYWHGGKSPGAPKGNQHALKHGHYTAKAKGQQKAVRELLKITSDPMKELSFHNAT